MAALAVIAIPVSDVVLFLGGGLRCRAPWFDGVNEGPCFSVITGVQQQCVTRGHCSAATPISGTVGPAGLPAECEWGGEAQARHTPATFSDASTVHPVADSARGTEKAQARHTPATFSDISTMHPAADSAWKNLKAESVPVRATSDKVIIQDGRSDPAAHSFEEFRLADASICFATRSEADEAMREMSLGRGFAILTVNIARVFVKKEVLFPKTCWLFAVVK